jgi:hypothetical protein
MGNLVTGSTDRCQPHQDAIPEGGGHETDTLSALLLALAALDKGTRQTVLRALQELEGKP